MADIGPGRAALNKRILEGDGQAAREQRKAAFANEGVPDAARPLLEKVTRSASKITDQDVAAAKAAGLSEDQVFELVVCGAIGQASRQYEGALAALEEATK